MLLLYHFTGVMGYTRNMDKQNVAAKRRYSVLDYAIIGSLLVVFGGVVLHAPLSVWLSTMWPQHELLIKSWKEIILGLAFLLIVVKLTTAKRWGLVRNKYMGAIALFAALNAALVPFSLAKNGGSGGGEGAAIAAGILINLRFLLFFALVFVAIRLYPRLVKPFVIVFTAGAVIVVGFAVLQLTVLPVDALKAIGYSESTIMPYLTVDQNPNYVRINSTLRGPNPLGLYAATVVTLVLAIWFRVRRPFRLGEKIGLWLLGGGAVVTLWASYSRSAVLAMLVAVACILFAVYGKRLHRKVWLGLAILVVVLGGSLYAFRDSQFVSQVVLHEDPLEGNSVNSNEGHISSLVDGVRRLVTQPLGGGIGSTGSASLLGNSPLIIENQYLFVAHENGWPGLALFLAISYFVLVETWRRRRSWLALGVFASGAGIMVAGLFLPVWTDDTISIVWWGLAAVAVAMTTQAPMRAQKLGRRGTA